MFLVHTVMHFDTFRMERGTAEVVTKSDLNFPFSEDLLV